jgi:NAD(P)-dependent dehydrogenase (short-subunit alcohol dehydrogenase family)
VADLPALPQVVSAIAAEHGPIGVLVNNAGYSQSGVLETLPIPLIREQFEANVFGLLRLTQLALPAMRAQRWGKIVNISSMGGEITLPGGGAYHASKHAVEALSDVLRFEVAGFGIDVIVIQPGLVRSRFFETAASSMDPTVMGPYADLERRVASATASGGQSRLAGSAEDVARVIERAITVHRPRPRYKVTPAAHVLMRLRRVLGDRGWDRLMRRYYVQPRGRP